MPGIFDGLDGASGVVLQALRTNGIPMSVATYNDDGIYHCVVDALRKSLEGLGDHQSHIAWLLSNHHCKSE